MTFSVPLYNASGMPRVPLDHARHLLSHGAPVAPEAILGVTHAQPLFFDARRWTPERAARAVALAQRANLRLLARWELLRAEVEALGRAVRPVGRDPWALHWPPPGQDVEAYEITPVQHESPDGMVRALSYGKSVSAKTWTPEELDLGWRIACHDNMQSLRNRDEIHLTILFATLQSEAMAADIPKLNTTRQVIVGPTKSWWRVVAKNGWIHRSADQRRQWQLFLPVEVP